MAKKDHGRAMLGLLESGKYSDLTLTCGDDEYRVHRAIVCPHSAFFEAACGGDFAVNYPSAESIGPVSTKADGNQEASSRTIALVDDDPETVQRMLSYMYSFDYQDERHELQPEVEDSDEQSSLPTEDGGPTLWSSVRVYALAEKYGIPELKEMAKKRFQVWVEKHWSCDDLPAMAKEIFESTPPADEGLRKTVTEVVATHIHELLPQESWVKAIGETSQLGLMVLLHYCDKEESAETLNKELESHIETLEIEKRAAEQRYAFLMGRINDGTSCSYCRASFNIIVDEEMRLVCRQCSTRY